jgi:hypothetical protein
MTIEQRHGGGLAASATIFIVLMAGCVADDGLFKPFSQRSPTPEPTTNRFYLALAPNVTTQALGGDVPIESPFGPGAAGSPRQVAWGFPILRGGEFGEVGLHIWVKVGDGNANQAPVGGCTWHAKLEFLDNGDGPKGLDLGCVEESATILPNAVRELTFGGRPSGAQRLHARCVVRLTLESNTRPMQGEDLFTLSGTAQYDSRLQLAGLREPL